MDRDNDHTDAEYDRREHMAEMGDDTPAEVAYFAWLHHLEEALEISDIDGDEKRDGYSLDSASDFYDEGMSVKEAAYMFRVSIAALVA